MWAYQFVICIASYMGIFFCHFRCLRFSASVQPVFCENCPIYRCVLDALCGGMNSTSSYSPTILTPDIFFSSVFLPFPKCYLSVFRQFIVFFTWHSNEIYSCCCCICHYLLFIAELNPVVWLFHGLFIHSLVDLDCLLV